MLYKVTIKETSKFVMDIEADTREEALRIAEGDYWKEPNEYPLEPYDTNFEIEEA